MRLRKLIAIVAMISLCLPAMMWAQTVQDNVRQLQENLQALGFYQGPIDGVYGPQTAEALREYQRTHGLAVTGTLDPETQQALEAERRTDTARTALATGAVGTAAGATLGAIAGSAAIGAAIGGPIGLAVGALGATLWTQLR